MALVGESGSGKSTIARMLARLTRPTSGVIAMDGSPVSHHSRAVRRYRGDVQMVFQDPFSSLNPSHTVGYHLRRPLRLHGIARSRAEEETEVLALLRRVSLTPAEQYVQKYPYELSGGQRQRVAIARALAPRPKVLLADRCHADRLPVRAALPVRRCHLCRRPAGLLPGRAGPGLGRQRGRASGPVLAARSRGSAPRPVHRRSRSVTIE